jgi:group I intron endonuclease
MYQGMSLVLTGKVIFIILSIISYIGGILIMIKGIYQIKNNINNKLYIGSSKDILKRWNNHIVNLNNRTHHSYKLQSDWIKYNITDFSFSILEVVYDDSKLLEKEQFYLDQYDIEDNYNVSAYTKYDNNISVPESFINTVQYMSNLEPDTINKLKENIIICVKSGKLKEIGKNEFDLSKTWFSKNAKNIKQLKLNMFNYLSNICGAKSNDIGWTTFTQYFHQLKYKGFIKSFIPLNGEIKEDTNKRNYLCFAANCYPNSFIKRKSDLDVNNDMYSLSILINWIISVSDINKPIHIYIPSQRMEGILSNWIKE